MKNNITLPTQTAAVAPGQKAGVETPAAAAPAAKPAEPAKAKTRDPLMEQMPPSVRKVLEKKLAAQAGSATIPNAAAELPAQQPMAAAKPEEKPKPEAGDEAKPKDETPEAGIIDFAELAKEATGGDEEGPKPLTEAELADLNIVKTKLTDAHKDNAQLRRQRREEREAKEKLQQQVEALNGQLQEAQAARQAPTKGGYLGRFTTEAEVHAAKADALEALRQLQEDPERDTILLPGNRPWKMTDAQGQPVHAQVAKTAFDILDGYEARLQQLGGRSAAEKLVEEKLPVMKKAIPDFEKSYKENLEADWGTRAPELSLHAAIGALVTSGEYVLRPKQAPKPETKPAPKKEPAAEAELPSATPGVRQVKDGAEDVTALKARYLKTRSPKDLSAWIKAGGRKHLAE